MYNDDERDYEEEAWQRADYARQERAEAEAAADDERDAATAVLLAMSGIVPTPVEGYRSFDDALLDVRAQLQRLSTAAQDAAAAERTRLLPLLSEAVDALEAHTPNDPLIDRIHAVWEDVAQATPDAAGPAGGE